MVEKREGLSAIWSEAPESKSQDPTGNDCDRQTVELPVWATAAEDWPCWAVLS